MDENAPPSQKSAKRRKPLRSHFKRTKNDERRSQAARSQIAEERVLQPVSTNVQQPSATLETLKTVDPPGWTLARTEKEDTIQFCIMRSDPPTVVRSLTVSADLTWYAHILGGVVPRSNAVIQSLPAKANSESSLLHILSTVQSARVCPGNPEEQFVRLLERKGGKACGRSGDICAYVDDKEEIVVDEKSYATTVRRSDCGLICSRNSSSLQRCPSCSKYRLQLFVERSREAKKSVNRTNHDSNVPYGCLTPSEKDERMRNLEKAKRAEKQKNTRLRELLQKEIGDKCVALVEKDSDDITALLSDVSPLVEKTFPKGSVQRIFWEQAKYNTLKDSRQMRWHPLLIRFALNLKYSSTSAYRAVRDSGLISLPSERTLRDYTHWVSIKDGPQVEVLRHIKKTIDLEKMSVSEKHFALSMDEMKVRSGLVFRKYTGELVGYCSLGYVNDDLERLTQSLNSGSVSTVPKLADQVLVFMIRHVFKPSAFFPVAMYPSSCLSGERLYPMVFDVIEYLEVQGFPVVSITSDGNSPNRRFYRICGLSDERPTYKTSNPFADGRDIYFFCDPPHLLKTARNCFANSYSHSRARILWVCSQNCVCKVLIYDLTFPLQKNGQDISWKHIEHLYLTENDSTGGVRLCPKLTRDHLWLNSYSKMRIYLAAQVHALFDAYSVVLCSAVLFSMPTLFCR